MARWWPTSRTSIDARLLAVRSYSGEPDEGLSLEDPGCVGSSRVSFGVSGFGRRDEQLRFHGGSMLHASRSLLWRRLSVVAWADLGFRLSAVSFTEGCM